jgi:type VI secretion system protein ImpB
MGESIQHKLDRVRPPRVQITYDVEIGGAFEMKELPFVMGVLADLSGNQENPLPPIKERKFVEVDRDNFNDVLRALAPRLALRVPNKIAAEGGETNVEIIFHTMDDFNPGEIVKNVPQLKTLYDTRILLKNMLSKLDGNDPLELLLKQLMSDSKMRDDLKKELDAASPPPPPADAAKPAKS